MLATAENDLLTRIGPGSAMGNMMRCYWVPALLVTHYITFIILLRHWRQ